MDLGFLCLFNHWNDINGYCAGIDYMTAFVPIFPGFFYWTLGENHKICDFEAPFLFSVIIFFFLLFYSTIWFFYFFLSFCPLISYESNLSLISSSSLLKFTVYLSFTLIHKLSQLNDNLIFKRNEKKKSWNFEFNLIQFNADIDSVNKTKTRLRL